MRLIEAGVVTVYASCSLWCDNPVDQSATLGLSDQIDHKQGEILPSEYYPAYQLAWLTS